MIGLGVAYTWLVIKVTLLAALVAVLYMPGGRGAGIRRGFLATSGLLCILGLSLSLFSPYPNWTRWAWQDPGLPGAATASSADARQQPVSSENQLHVRPESGPTPERGEGVGKLPSHTLAGTPNNTPDGGESAPSATGNNALGPRAQASQSPQQPGGLRPGESSPRLAQPLFPVWRRLLHSLANLSAKITAACEDSPRLRWFFGVLGLGLAGTLALGVMRLVVAMVSVAQFQRRLHPVTSARLLESLDIVLAQTGCRTPIRLMTCDDLSSPATIGVRRPVIILPADHAEWSDEQIQGVLAHEVGHVLNRDYLWWCLAQVVVVFHFFNPLVMRLVYWLRLQQELAADAVAVGVIGNARQYLEVLASMAVREHQSSLPLTARTFLPIQGTLASRIEMLRAGNCGGRDRSTRGRGILGLGLALVACALSGLRIETQGGMQAEGPPLSRLYVPSTARTVLAFQPESLRNSPAFAGWNGAIGERTLYGQPLTDFEQVTVFRTRLADDSLPDPQTFSGLVLHCSSTELAQQVLSRVHSGPQPNQAGEWNPFELLSNQGVSARLMDERVVVITAMSEELELSQAADGRSLAVAEWQQAWDRQSRAPFRLLLTKEGLRTWSGKAGQPPQAGKSGEPQLRPEWQELMADLERVSGLADVFLISGVGPEGNALELAVVPAEGTTGWEVDFATQSVLRNLGHRFHGWARDARSQAGADSPLGNWLEQLANGLKSSAAQEPQSVSGARIWRGPVNGMDQPGRRAWQEQWDDSQSPVAARVLAKALQRFHDSHGRWPSAMERRTPSEPPHSWRVALLPHLGMNELYESYQFDKSWDDPANRHVLARMPDCFLAVGSPRSSTRWILPQASGPTGGPGSVDESVPPGSEFLLVATPKVAIPWTMPESEPCDERLLDLIRRDGAHAVLLTGEQELRRYHFQPGAGGIR